MTTITTPSFMRRHLLQAVILTVFPMVTILLPVMGYSQSASQSDSTSPATTVSVEIDPAPYLSKGYSVSVRYSHKALPHWSLMGSVFQGGLPDLLLTKTNKELGWRNLRFRPSYALFADYSIRRSGKGLFFGPAVFLYNNSISSEATGQPLDFQTIYPNIRLGYTVFPFKRTGLYLTPWVNVGKELPLGAATRQPAFTYQLSPAKYIVALHVGYRFNRKSSAKP